MVKTWPFQRGCWWPPNRGWKGHLEEPGMIHTWNLKRMVSKRNLLFKGAIFRFHVKIWEGIYRRATAHAADPRFHGNLRHERKKKGSKKKEVRFFGWGRLSGRVRFEVSSVGCVSGSVYGDFLDSFWGAVLRCRLLFNWWCSMGECIEHLRNRWNQSKTTAWMEPRRRPSAPGAKRLSTS